jgi:hypothetical protein
MSRDISLLAPPHPPWRKPALPEKQELIMTVTMTIAALYMVVFWSSSLGAFLTATAGRTGWTKFFISLSVIMLVLSTAQKPLTLVDLACGAAITMLVGAVYVFIGWKITALTKTETETH